MANIQSFYALDTTGLAWSVLWKLSRCMKAAGWTYKASSDGTAKDTTGTAANDKWGGNVSPMVDAYPTAHNTIAGPWIVLAGPPMLRVLIGAASVGTFTRGEKVTGGTSGATGEVLGYVFDPTNLGWMIVAPRTGTFTGTEVYTGAVSAATVTATSLKTYSQEVVFAKTVTTNNTAVIYWVVADASAESASLFSTLAASAGCTALVAPAAGGTANAFPTIAIAVLGTGGAMTGGVIAPASLTVHALISALNATPAANLTADGTFWAQMSVAGSTTTSMPIGLFRLDDSEPGDVCPYAFYYSSGTAVASYSRTLSTSTGNLIAWASLIAGGVCQWNSYIGRGVGGVPGTAPDVSATFSTFASVYAGASMWNLNAAGLVSAQNHPAATKPQATDTLILGHYVVAANQMFKGRVRWIRLASAGAVFDTTDAKTWECCMSGTGTTQAAIYLGPWDGVTVPAA